MGKTLKKNKAPKRLHDELDMIPAEKHKEIEKYFKDILKESKEKSGKKKIKKYDLSEFVGTVKLKGDFLKYQKKIRNEW